MLDGEHYFLLEPSASGTRFTQGEQLYGVLLWLFDAQQLEPRFAAMNVALEARAEHDPPADMRLGAPWTDQGSN